MSTYIQNDIENSGIDIVLLTNNGNIVVPITTAEAVVWHEGDTNMTLREKIETLNLTPGETTTYEPGSGIGIDSNTINVLVDGDTIKINESNKLYVNNLRGQISEALSDYLNENPLINTEIKTELPDTGESNTLYLIGTNNDLNDSFEEYIWVVDKSVTPNVGYWEKLGTTEFDVTKLDTVYAAIFYDPKTESETGNKILDHTSSIEGIKGELGTTSDNTTSTIYGRLKNLEENYTNILGLSFSPTNYELTYTYDIEDLYSSNN